MNELNQVVFANIDVQEPWTIDSYIASGGYEAWKNILNNFFHITLKFCNFTL